MPSTVRPDHGCVPVSAEGAASSAVAAVAVVPFANASSCVQAPAHEKDAASATGPSGVTVAARDGVMDCVTDGVTLAAVVALAELVRDALGDRDVEAPVFDDDEVADTLADLEREGARLLEILVDGARDTDRLVLIVCDAERELLSIRVSDRDELREDDGNTLLDVVRETETVTFTDADEVNDGDKDGEGAM
jgi:hypothetical protein